MTSLNEYGQHTWHYTYNNEAKTEVIFKTQLVFCDEVVEELACYLMATGFFQSSIIEAFERYVEEHKRAYVSGAKRLEQTMVGEGE